MDFWHLTPKNESQLKMPSIQITSGKNRCLVCLANFLNTSRPMSSRQESGERTSQTTTGSSIRQIRMNMMSFSLELSGTPWVMTTCLLRADLPPTIYLQNIHLTKVTFVAAIFLSHPLVKRTGLRQRDDTSKFVWGHICKPVFSGQARAAAWLMKSQECTKVVSNMANSR